MFVCAANREKTEVCNRTFPTQRPSQCTLTQGTSNMFVRKLKITIKGYHEEEEKHVMTRMSLVMNNTCYIFILPFTALAFLSVRPTYAHIRVLVLHCAKIHIDHTVFSTAVPT